MSGVYNLNYDNVALTASPGAYVGFDENGQFDAAEVQARRDWDFIYHLHGCVHHTLQGVFANSMGWQKDLSGVFDDGSGGRSLAIAARGEKTCEGRRRCACVLVVVEEGTQHPGSVGP